MDTRFATNSGGMCICPIITTNSSLFFPFIITIEPHWSARKAGARIFYSRARDNTDNIELPLMVGYLLLVRLKSGVGSGSFPSDSSLDPNWGILDSCSNVQLF